MSADHSSVTNGAVTNGAVTNGRAAAPGKRATREGMMILKGILILSSPRRRFGGHHEMRTAAKEQDPPIAERKQSAMRDRCCHLPSAWLRAKNATEVESSQTNLNLACTQLNENTVRIQTLRAIRTRDKWAQ